jgi:RimJ/RimL family protein N-acetyltransferase
VTFDLQPLLTSDLVILRPLHGEDFEDLYGIASDPQLWRQHPSKDRTDERVFRIWFDEALASGGALVAEDAVSSDVIGTSRFARRSDGSVEIGWTFLARSRWGGTWNGEIKRLMLAHAFASVPEVTFTVHSANTRSQRAVLRLGATQVGAEPDAHGRGRNFVYRLRRP